MLKPMKRIFASILAILVIIGSSMVGYAANGESDLSEKDTAYLESLKEAGFPKSYRTQLLKLHKKYPKWKFQAVKTGLTWEEVMEAEGKNGANLIHMSADDAKKTTSTGAYSWLTNTWKIYDGSAWVGAHKDYIAYCMDPRNFLNETDIFQFESLSYQPEHKEEVVKAILKKTFMEKTVKDTDGKKLNYAKTFMKIGKIAGVSPYLLATRVRQEQGTGKSSLISGKYKGYQGYFNYFNFQAYGKTRTELIKRGLAFAKSQGWNSRYKSLLGGAKLLGSNYIRKGQDTLYFQKFNVVYKNELYIHQYMTNVEAAISEGRNVAKGYANKNQAFTFRIPVYKSMPAKAVAFNVSGNPNNYIRQLCIGIDAFDEQFDPYVKEYQLEVDGETEILNVTATPVYTKATVIGTGKISLKEGKNIIKVKCKSQKGTTRTYKIMVIRKSREE